MFGLGGIHYGLSIGVPQSQTQVTSLYQVIAIASVTIKKVGMVQ
jgi:hypothetical protein